MELSSIEFVASTGKYWSSFLSQLGGLPGGRGSRGGGGGHSRVEDAGFLVGRSGLARSVLSMPTRSILGRAGLDNKKYLRYVSNVSRKICSCIRKSRFPLKYINNRSFCKEVLVLIAT